MQLRLTIDVPDSDRKHSEIDPSPELKSPPSRAYRRKCMRTSQAESHCVCQREFATHHEERVHAQKNSMRFDRDQIYCFS